MRVLWITNTLFPDVCSALKLDTPVIGGWMYAGARSLLANAEGLKLAVASLYSGKNLQILHLGGITYYLLPAAKNNSAYNSNLEQYWKQITDLFLPDVVHIHGTEYPHGLAFIKACGSEKVVVSVQGLVSVYERYYYGGISEKEISKNITIRDILRKDTLIDQRNKMIQRGGFEKQTIKNIQHVIGRTEWDKAHVWAINPAAKYHFCNETLRSEFYNYQWTYEECEKYSIFLSQAHYPIKGLQQVIAALPFIVKAYPQTKVYIAGSQFINSSFLKLNGFGKYIHTQIKLHGLQDHIVFVGTLNEQQMCQQFLRANVFVCPSSIENSPNSIGEAQLLGVPCVAAYVGGMADMVEDEESGLLYRFEEVEMLAEKICKVFGEPLLVKKLSQKGQAAAMVRHNDEVNSLRLGEIYAKISSVNKVKLQAQPAG